MKNIDSIWNLIDELSKYENSTIKDRVLKLMEESGELSAEVLKISGYKVNNLSPDELRKKILLESVDCLVVIMNILITEKYTKEEVIEMSNQQINKWINQKSLQPDKLWKNL